jgi:hypothetical protein
MIGIEWCSLVLIRSGDVGWKERNDDRWKVVGC